MLIEFIIILQIVSIFIFLLSYKNKVIEGFFVVTIFAAILSFAYMNIEVGETRPVHIDSSSDIIDIEYDKIVTIYNNNSLMWINIGFSVISCILGLYQIFEWSGDQIKWRKD